MPAAGKGQAQPGGGSWPGHWALPRTFFMAPLCQDLEELRADVAFLGVPFDQGTSYRPGAHDFRCLAEQSAT